MSCIEVATPNNFICFEIKASRTISKSSSLFLDFFIVSPFVNIAFDDGNGFTDCLKTNNFESDHRAVELCLSESFDNILKCPA